MIVECCYCVNNGDTIDDDMPMVMDKIVMVVRWSWVRNFAIVVEGNVGGKRW